MKLHIMLSAMIAALAIPGSLAGDAKPEAAMEAAPSEKKDAKMAEGKKKHHHKKHRKHHHGGGSTGGHTPDKWDAPYDQIQKDDGTACGGSSDASPVAGPTERVGQKMP